MIDIISSFISIPILPYVLSRLLLNTLLACDYCEILQEKKSKKLFSTHVNIYVLIHFRLRKLQFKQYSQIHSFQKKNRSE